MSEYCPYTYQGYPAGAEYPWTFPMPSEKERDRRWAAIRREMSQSGFDCLVVGAPYGYMPTPYNLQYYISNFVTFFNHGAYVVFPLKGEPMLRLATNIGPQFQHCAAETTWIKEIVASLYPAPDVIRKIGQLNLEKGKIGVVGYRMGVMAASVYDALRDGLPQATFEDATEVLFRAMDEVSRSSAEELALVRKACDILDCSFDAVAEIMKPGVAEYELWAAAERAIINNGGWFPHFMIATSGPSPSFLRAPASHNKLQPGDLAMFEINSIYAGISVQICYALCLGQPREDIAAMFALCDELYPLALAGLEKRKTFMEIELELARRIHAAGYEPMTPQIHLYNQSGRMIMDSPPQPGDYFTVHPNAGNKEFMGGGKYGDTVRLGKDGRVERLARTPAKLHIIQP